MRNRLLSAMLAAAIFLLGFVSIATYSIDAGAVTPPTVQERSEATSSGDQHKKAEWFGREATTVDGRACECGRSKTDPHKCYVPRKGQYCCNPRTGECRMLEIGKVNTPW